MDHETQTRGSCRCGQVTIIARGHPLMTFACHCTGCQRMTASAFSLSAMYPEAAVTIAGETVLGGMRAELQHHFCPSCLSWLFTTAPVMGPTMNIRSSLLENGPARDPAFIECWTREKLPWAETRAAHSYEEFPPAEDFGPLMAAFAQSRG